MAFDKEEVKQLKNLFDDQEKRIIHYVDKRFDIVDNRFSDVGKKFIEQDSKFDQKLDGLESRIYKNFDQKLSVQRFEISQDTKSIIDAKLKPIHEKLDRFFEMESEDIGGSYQEVTKIKQRLFVLEQRVGIKH